MKKNYSSGKWYLNDQLREIYENYQRYQEASISPGHIWTNCVQCQISFITTNSNRSRSDIRCPFGCRQTHLRAESNRRSTAYNKTEEGKAKKKLLNRRKNISPELDPTKQPPIPKTISPYLHYIQFFLFSIFGKLISFPDIKELVFKAQEKLRQHPLEEVSKMIILTGYD